MEKRALLAVVLSIAVFYVFSLGFGPDKKNQPSVAPLKNFSSTVSAPVAPVQQVVPQQAPDPAVSRQAQQKDIVVETDLYTAVFTSQGAAVKSITLKRYRETNAPDAKPVVLGTNADPGLHNFATRATGFNLAEQAVYTASANELKISGAGAGQLVFSYVADQGYVVRKVYSFKEGSYGISLDTQLINNTPSPVAGSFRHVMTYPSEIKSADSRFETAGSYIYSDNALHADKSKDVASAEKKYDKSVLWGGFADKYFLTAISSDKNTIASVELKKNKAGYMESVVNSQPFTVTPGQMASVVQTLFVGPKDIDVLKAQGGSLEQSLDLGWFTAIAKPLLYTLKFFYQYVGNYGVAIIIITVILKMLFFPLTHKSYKSMKGMQKIQPKMAALKEKYKDDRDAMNKAVMELYRDHKVNPLGGCLPMLVQIPVFFALYKALMFSIELRHAPFFLWVHDLADKDPYYVTPIIMGVTMFIQQKMTPSQMDPIQQKMMLALPVVFTFMFLSFPSGLVLYWLVNNILTIGQQMYINKLVKD